MSSMPSAHGARGVRVTSNSNNEVNVMTNHDVNVTTNHDSNVTTNHDVNMTSNNVAINPAAPQRRVRTQSRPENDSARNNQVRLYFINSIQIE